MASLKKLWAQFVPTAGPVKREVAWTRDEVLVGSVDFRNPSVSFLIHIVVLLLVNNHHRNAASRVVASGWVGQGLIIFMAWSSRSVARQCGPSFELGRRALSVGWL